MPLADRKLGGVVLALALLLAVAPGVAAAQSFQGASDVVVVGPNERYASIEGVAGTVVVRGTVTGDVSTAAGSVHVTESGTVDGDVAAVAGNVRIDGTVGGNVDAAGSTVTVGETGDIGGSLEVGAAALTIDGTVDGAVRAGAETIVLGPTAIVGGEFRYDAATFSRAPDATIEGSVVQDDTIGERAGPSLGGVPAWLGAVYGLLANLLLGALLLAAFPRFSARVASRATSSPVTASGVGLGTLVAVPLVLVLFAVTIVGIPLSLLGAVLFALAVWVAVVYGQFAVGTWALSLVDRESRWLALLVGLVGFAVLGAVPVLGAVLQLIALLLGLGALALAIWTRGRREDTSGGRQTTLDEAAGDSAAT